MVKVAVKLLLEIKPEMGRKFEPFPVIFVLPMQTYFELVSSRFGTNDEGISHFFKLLTIHAKILVLPPCLRLQEFQLFKSSLHI